MLIWRILFTPEWSRWTDVVPVGVYRAVGGLHDAPTPGDMQCAALAACQDSAVRMVANRLGAEILALKVRVTAKVDVRGALGIDAEVPVGFQSISCDIDLQLKEGTPSKLREALKSAAQKCCVVQQTLHHPPPVMARFFFIDTVRADSPLEIT